MCSCTCVWMCVYLCVWCSCVREECMGMTQHMSRGQRTVSQFSTTRREYYHFCFPTVENRNWMGSSLAQVVITCEMMTVRPVLNLSVPNRMEVSYPGFLWTNTDLEKNGASALFLIPFPESGPGDVYLSREFHIHCHCCYLSRCLDRGETCVFVRANISHLRMFNFPLTVDHNDRTPT